MKKYFLGILAIGVLLSAVGCGQKAEAPKEETTSQETAAASQAETNPANDTTEASAQEQGAEETTEEETENYNSVNGVVQSVEDGILKVEVEDGSAASFDVSEAEMNEAWELMAGDEVGIYFDGEEWEDGMKAVRVSMLVPVESTLEEYYEDPSIYGRVDQIDDESITLTEILDERNEDAPEGEDELGAYLGETYTFKRASYETLVTKGGVKEGTQVLLHYTGKLDEDPEAYRVCTEDIMDDEAANVIAIHGVIDKVSENVLYLKAEDGTVLKFDLSERDDLVQKAEAAVGKEANVEFTGSIRQRVVPADDIKI